MKLCQLPVGTKVREPVSGRVFLVAAHDHPGYSGTILWSDRIVRKGCFDGKEAESTVDRVKRHGCNNYAHSNVHQWLNSSRQDWFEPAHEGDAPPSAKNTRVFLDKKTREQKAAFKAENAANAYDQTPGFLTSFPQSFVDALVENEIPYVEYAPDGSCRRAYVRAKFFLLSADELGLRRFTGVAEGSLMPLFYDFRMRLGFKEAVASDFNFPGAVTENNTEMGWYYWLRTPHHTDPCLSAHVHWSGYISYHQCNNSSIGILPACALKADTTVSEEPDEDLVYDLMLGGAAE